jgi:hypothetical protein
MMFKLAVDPSSLANSLSDMNARHIPFIVSKALNAVANDAQKAERAHIQSAFHIRRPWVLNGVYIGKEYRATKTAWAVVIQIQGDRDFLNRFERGDLKFPLHGKWVWVPNADVFKGQVVMYNDPLHPRNLHFRQMIKGRQMVGDQRTFMINGKGTRGPLVLQRVSRSGKGVSQRIGQGYMRKDSGRDVGSGRFTAGVATRRLRAGGVRMLYTLVSKVKIPVRLKFVETITEAVNANWSSRLDDAMNYALNIAK